MLYKNKQCLYYSQFEKEVPVYEKDDDGNIKYMEIDGVQVPVETGEVSQQYSVPKEFNGNIVISGGNADSTLFGVDLSHYEAILLVDKDLLSIDETSLIWHENSPVFNLDGSVDQYSADYIVIKRIPSLNVIRYGLKKVVK